MHSRLRVLHRPARTDHLKTVLIVVPGLGTTSPEAWHDGSSTSWLWSSSFPFAKNGLVLCFEHRLGLPARITQQLLEKEGGDLLYEIQRLCEGKSLLPDVLEYCTPQQNNSPIVLVAHSVGGVVVKRATRIAYRNNSLPARIAGAIFLSTPHSKLEESPAWNSLALIFRCFGKLKRREILSADLVKALCEDCRYFEQAFNYMPVLSVYEEAETRTGLSPWNKSKLVNETLARTNVDTEQLHGLPLDHGHIACLDAVSGMVDAVKTFVDKSLQCYDSHQNNHLSVPDQESNAPSSSGIISGSSTDPVRRAPSTIISSHPNPQDTHIQAPPSAGATSLDLKVSWLDLTTSQSEPKLPCFVMPYGRNQWFRGRSDTLSEIADVLCKDLSTPRIRHSASFALAGAGGIGKTQVAIEFVHRHIKDFDAIFWITADEVEKIYQSFVRIAIDLGLLVEDSIDAKDKTLARDLVLGWLAHPLKSHKQREHERVGEASWLVVFDNVDDPNILDDFWPYNASGSILITSRDPLADSQFFSSTSGKVLKPFSTDETAEFLLALTRRQADEEDNAHVFEVAKILGGMPLAIAQMAGVIARKETTFAEFSAMYKDDDLRFEMLPTKVGGKRVFQDYQHTLATVWDLHNLKHSVYLLDVLSFLDPDGIPEYIVAGNKASTDMEGYPSSSAQYEHARTELLQSSLITRDRSAKKLVIHRVIQDTARAKMNDARYSEVFTSALQLLSSVWPYEEEFGFMNETERWAKCNELYPHIQRLCDLQDRLRPPWKLSPEHLQPPKLLLEAAWFSIMRAEYEDTWPFLQMAETMFEPLNRDTKGHATQDEAVIDEFEEQVRLFELHPGVLGLHVNEPKKSLLHLKQFRDMLRKKLGDRPRGKDQRMGVAWNELGNAYMQNKATKQAESCFRASIEAIESLDDVTPNTISMPMINLGYALWFQNRNEEAGQTFQEALDAREEEYGRNDTVSFATGKLFLGYGNVKAAQGDLDGSFDLHKRCLAQYKATLGPYHHRVADGLVRVSDHLVRLARYAEALALLDQACKIYEPRPQFAPEKARAYFRRHSLHKLMDTVAREDGVAALEQYRLARPGDVRELAALRGEAQKDGIAALKQYRIARPEDARGLEELRSEDFDSIVIFWSR